MRKKLLFFSILLIFTTLLAQKHVAEQDESFDPMKLNEPPPPFNDKTMIYEIVTDIDEKLSTPESVYDSLHFVEKMGWKVQIFSSSDFFEADTAYRLALESFEGYDVEKIFNSPYYKIRIGNCVSREEAEDLLYKATKLNFKDAWIIRTRVKVKEKVLSY